MLLESPAVGLLGLRIFELPADGLPEFTTQLPGETSVVARRERRLNQNAGTKARRCEGAHPNFTEALVQAIPIDDEELREPGEDLRAMGCEGLLT